MNISKNIGLPLVFAFSLCACNTPEPFEENLIHEMSSDRQITVIHTNTPEKPDTVVFYLKSVRQRAIPVGSISRSQMDKQILNFMISPLENAR